MIGITFDTRDFMKTVTNTVNYGKEFALTVQREKVEFNRELGKFVAEILGLYIDSMAATNPDELHHVYEWGRAGDIGARLFRFTSDPSGSTIRINGYFLDSQSTSPNANRPFTEKASVMEAGLTVVIEPVDSEMLAFEGDDGEPVFALQSIVENPGGIAVEGAFKNTVQEFFTGYLSKAVLGPILNDMRYPVEFMRNFKSGTRIGSAAGRAAARQYLKLPEVTE